MKKIKKIFIYYCFFNNNLNIVFFFFTRSIRRWQHDFLIYIIGNEKIIKKNKNKELVDTIIGKIKKLKGDDKVKKIAALKSFINNKQL